MRYCARYHTVASIFPVLLILCLRTALAQQQDYPVKSVPFTNVNLTDNFWLPHYAWAHRGKGEMMIWFRQTIFQQ